MKNPANISTHRARMELLVSTALARCGESRTIVNGFLLAHKVTPESFAMNPARTIARIIDEAIRHGYTIKQENEALEKALSPDVLDCVRDFIPMTRREAKQRAIAFCRMIESEEVQT